MSYRVAWTRHAEAELAQIWLDAVDRAAIAEAAREIDAALVSNPKNCGESRADGKRIFFADPLVVVFRILEGDVLVRVLGVRRYGKA